MIPALQKGVTLFGRLKKKEVETLDFLNAKQVLIQPRNRMQKLAGLQVSAIKPLHLEISYRLFGSHFLVFAAKGRISRQLGSAFDNKVIQINGLVFICFLCFFIL